MIGNHGGGHNEQTMFTDHTGCVFMSLVSLEMLSRLHLFCRLGRVRNSLEGNVNTPQRSGHVRQARERLSCGYVRHCTRGSASCLRGYPHSSVQVP